MRNDAFEFAGRRDIANVKKIHLSRQNQLN